MALQSGSRRRSQRPEEEREAPVRHEADDAAQRILALQRTAGNQAVGAALQRKVKVGGAKTKWIANKRMLPAMPNAIATTYPNMVAQIQAEADKWAGDKMEDGRVFTDATAFYTAVAGSLTRQAAADTPEADDRNRWDILKEAVIASGKVTEVPWTTFNAKEEPLLKAELLACPVQLAGTASNSTACHGNKHKKLPKPVGPFTEGKVLDQLPKWEQPDNTPYFEMLVALGQKKKSGIERAIIDIESGEVYLTAHYDKGSIAWLSGAPQEIAADWRAKVEIYRATLRATRQ